MRTECMWKILVYATLVGVGLWASVGEYWFWDTKGYWSDCSRLPCEAPTLPRVCCMTHCFGMEARCWGGKIYRRFLCWLFTGEP